MNAVDINIPTAQLKKRFGLIPARIGATFAHKLTVEIPLDDPLYSTATGAVGAKARTRLGAKSSAFSYATRNGAQVPVKALPGATIQLDVQDISRLDEDLVGKVEWYCRHRDCNGKRHKTKEDLVRAHAKNKDLEAEAERDPRGEAHVYLGIVEIAGAAEQKDEKSGKTRPLQIPTVILVSDEE